MITQIICADALCFSTWHSLILTYAYILDCCFWDYTLDYNCYLASRFGYPPADGIGYPLTNWFYWWVELAICRPNCSFFDQFVYLARWIVDLADRDVYFSISFFTWLIELLICLGGMFMFSVNLLNWLVELLIYCDVFVFFNLSSWTILVRFFPISILTLRLPSLSIVK